jgi:hypothetical protein
MKLLPIAAVAGALALGGCSSLQSLLSGDSLAQTAPVASVDAEKALAVAHLAYQAAGVTLDAADAADAALNAQGVIEAVTEAQAAIAELRSLIKK